MKIVTNNNAPTHSNTGLKLGIVRLGRAAGKVS